MIARAPYLFLLLILIPDLYLDLHYWRHRYSTGKRLLHWLPSLLLTALTLKLTYEKDFIPDDPTLLYIYLFLLGFIAIPKLVYVLCSILGLGACKLFHSKRNYGNLIGALLVPILWYIFIYGSFVGFQKMEVNRHTYSSPDLPAAFNNYKIVLFSDAHVGTLTGSRQWMLQRAVDSINAQHPDMIVFAGDLQNLQPKELYKQMDILSSLKAKDGIYSVLGNHDYAQYVTCCEAEKAANCKEIISLERQMGWTVLLNDHKVIQRSKDHLVIAGMENDGDGERFPQKGDINKTLSGTNGFTILLEHDPSSWRRKIIPDGRAQLTLSGHTHKMQFALFDWCPMSLTGKEFNGWYTNDSQSLFVTAGLGGLIPFRFGAPGEVVVITLKR